MGTAIKHAVPDRVKPSFALLTSRPHLAQDALQLHRYGNSGHQRFNFQYITWLVQVDTHHRLPHRQLSDDSWRSFQRLFQLRHAAKNIKKGMKCQRISLLNYCSRCTSDSVRRHCSDFHCTLIINYTLAEWMSSVLRPRQHSMGYMGDGFYR